MRKLFSAASPAFAAHLVMVCGLEQGLWDFGDIVKMIEEWDAAE